MAEERERPEQVAVIEWTQWQAGQYPEIKLLYAVPNGGERNPVVAQKMSAEGVKSGVPDLCLPVARAGYFGFYIEMKAPETPTKRAGQIRVDQKQWLSALKQQGYKTTVCYNADEVIQALDQYLKAEPTIVVPPETMSSTLRHGRHEHETEQSI